MSKVINNLLYELEGVRKIANGWMACCPAHEDNKPSLSIKDADDGRILLYCHAGCDFESIIQSLKDKNPNLLMFKQKNTEIVAEYNYVNEDGELLYQVVRYEPKTFKQRKPDGKGGWIYNMQGVRRVIYNLPEVKCAIERDDTIYFTEGEKDANKLAELGLVSTTVPMGAGKWKEEYKEFFSGANVVIFPDNDKPGLNHANQVARNLMGVAKSIKVIMLPDLPPKGDISDWLESGNTKNKLIELAQSEQEFVIREEDSNINDFRFTDVGNAKRLVNKYGQRLRYCFQNGKWLIWKEVGWEWDEKGEIMQYAKSIASDLFQEEKNAKNEHERTTIKKWAMESEAQARLNAMIKLAQSEQGIPVSFSELDVDQWKLNCINGTVDLKTGAINDHNRDDLITKLAPVIYEKEANSERFDEFLNRILPSEELRDFVKAAAGYSITGDTSEEKLFLAYGPPATGKSTLFAAMSAALGDYAATTDFETFIEKKNASGPRNDIARLDGKRFVLSSEIDDGKKMAESLVKQVTGGDVITARFLHKEYFEFRPVFKLWLATNFQPRVSHNDMAMWRRIIQIPFNVHIPKEERDPSLKLYLQNTTEAGPAVLAWLVKGCLKWQETGLVVPEVVEEATTSYREQMDPLREFFEDCCTIHPLVYVTNTMLWEEYERWARENGERFPIGRRKFKQALEERGFKQMRSSHSRYWNGIGLKADNRYSSYKEEIKGNDRMTDNDTVVDLF